MMPQLTGEEQKWVNTRFNDRLVRRGSLGPGADVTAWSKSATEEQNQAETLGVETWVGTQSRTRYVDPRTFTPTTLHRQPDASIDQDGYAGLCWSAGM